MFNKPTLSSESGNIKPVRRAKKPPKAWDNTNTIIAGSNRCYGIDSSKNFGEIDDISPDENPNIIRPIINTQNLSI